MEHTTPPQQRRWIIFWLISALCVCVSLVAYIAIETIETILKVLYNPKLLARSLGGLIIFVILYFLLSFLSGDLYFQKGKLKIKDSKEDADNSQYLA